MAERVRIETRARKVARWNGCMLALASPLFLVFMPTAKTWTEVSGCVAVFALWLFGGIAAYMWGRREN